MIDPELQKAAEQGDAEDEGEEEIQTRLRRKL
jgi:hypothetical protein